MNNKQTNSNKINYNNNRHGNNYKNNYKNNYLKNQITTTQIYTKQSPKAFFSGTVAYVAFIVICLLLLTAIIAPLVYFLVYKKDKAEPNPQPSKYILHPEEAADIVGYYSWAWDNKNPKNAETTMVLGIYYSGDTPKNTLKNIPSSNLIKAREKFINIGGDTEESAISRVNLSNINKQLYQYIREAGWTGICYNFKVCRREDNPDDIIHTLTSHFNWCNDAGLKVMVATSHLSPYGCSPAQKTAFENACHANSHIISYISPLLYTDGTTLELPDATEFISFMNKFATKSKILAGLPFDSAWKQVQTFAMQHSYPFDGYTIWKQ